MKMETSVKGTTNRKGTESDVAVVEMPAVSTVAKTRLFWRKACDSIKESTNTEIKDGEVFGVTEKKVFIENPKASEPGQPKHIESTVYSLKRGKRMYYTPYVTPEQEASAQAQAKVKADEAAKVKETKEIAKAEKAKSKEVPQPAAIS